VNGSFLPGTVREFLLEHAPVPIREETIPYARIHQTTEAFLTNSIMGIVPVAQIDERKFPACTETTELLRWLLAEATNPAVGLVQNRVTPGERGASAPC
jgi:branched-subunit amino acid aminotransferase/4-amino-4-deoxychorismate lyase